MALERVVVLNDLSQAKGGATGLALMSARRLSAAGLDVTYICGDEGHSAEAGSAQVLAAGSAQLLQRGALHAMRRGIYNPDTRDMVRRIIAETDTPGTVYHLHGWAQILSPSVFDALAPVADRCFVHAHDMFLACPNGVYMDYPHNQVCTKTPLSTACLLTHCDKRSRVHKGWRVLRQRSLRRTFRQDLPWAGILAIHPEMLPRLSRAGYAPDRFHVVRNPTDPFAPKRISAETNRRFVYVGRLEADKGALDFAQATQRIGVPATCVGDGSLRAHLERDFPDLQITGWQDRAAVGQYLSDARVLVMPSRHPEPFALVLPEAILSGLPVATAQTALMAREIEDQGLGYAFDVFDPASIDTALTRFRDMPDDELRDMSLRGHASATRLSHTPESWTDALVELYTSVL